MEVETDILRDRIIPSISYFYRHKGWWTIGSFGAMALSPVQTSNTPETYNKIY